MRILPWKIKEFVLIAMLVATFLGHADDTYAQSAAAFYKGKTITWICPFSPGGGYDTWARVLAPAVQKHTGAIVVVKNMPGGSGLVGSNYMYTRARPDGLTIGITQTFTMIIDYLFENPAVKYDFKKLTWLERLSTDEYVFSVGKDSRYKSLREIKAAPRFKIALDSRTAVNGAGVTAFALATGLDNASVVAGYAGSSEVKLAVLAGEADGTSTSIGSQWQQLRDGQFVPLAVVGKGRSKELPDVSTIYELNPNMPAATKKWVDQLTTLQGIGRAVFAPPGVPKDRADFLREVIRKALKEPDVINRLEKHKFYVVHLSSAEYLKELESLELTARDRTELQHLLLKKY